MTFFLGNDIFIIGDKMYIRHINFKYISNMRDIGGYGTKDGRVTKFNRIYRSNFIKNLEKEELSFLQNNHLCLAIDLRSSEDNNIKPNYLNDKVEFNNIYLPDSLPRDEKDIPNSYINIIENKELKTVFELIKTHKDLVIISCSMGKDRTGVVIMLLMLLCGVNNKDIIADYNLSYNYLKDDVNLYHLNHPQAAAWVGASKSWYMEEAIKLFYNRFHDVKGYFIDYLGMDEDSLSELKESLLYAEKE